MRSPPWSTTTAARADGRESCHGATSTLGTAGAEIEGFVVRVVVEVARADVGLLEPPQPAIAKTAARAAEDRPTTREGLSTLRLSRVARVLPM
jgi:hypothetical protein